MEIKFQTKEESKKEQLKAFLKLTPTERVLRFFKLMQEVDAFPTKRKPKNRNNFEIIITTNEGD